MQTILLVFHVLLAVALIVLVLLQHGRGADAGAAFGSGASSTVFGARGSASFLTRTTAILATLFFVTSLSLAYLFGAREKPVSVTERVAPSPVTKTESAPAPAEDKPAEPASDVPSLPDR